MILCSVMRVIGIDEAGYGPLLGPLVVAAVELETEGGYEPSAIWRELGASSGVGDSKRVLSHRVMAGGEAATLGLLAAAQLHPRSRRELLEALLVPAPGAGPSPWECDLAAGDFSARACHPDEVALPRWGGGGPAPAIDEALAQAGGRLRRVRAMALCPGRFNQALERCATKADVNWTLFHGLIERSARWLAPDGLAVCDKLGGRHQYGALLAELGLSSIVVEGRARSAYDVGGLGRVEFLRGADNLHPPVAMASMVAKVIREHLLDQWHGLLASQIEGLEPCSGYRDPVTKRYVARTAQARLALGIPDACFLRSR